MLRKKTALKNYVWGFIGAIVICCVMRLIGNHAKDSRFRYVCKVAKGRSDRGVKRMKAS